MSCCCSNIYQKFCAVSTCDEDEFKTGLLAQSAGIHKLVFEFLGVDYEIESGELEVGEEINFPTKGMNESAEVVAKVLDPDGEQLTFTEDLKEFDCFVLRTKIKYSLTAQES